MGDRASPDRWLVPLMVLIALGAICAVIAPVGLRKYEAWKQQRQFNELMRLIETTVEPASGDCESNLTLEYGGGQEVHSE